MVEKETQRQSRMQTYMAQRDSLPPLQRLLADRESFTRTYLSRNARAEHILKGLQYGILSDGALNDRKRRTKEQIADLVWSFESSADRHRERARRTDIAMTKAWIKDQTKR